MLYPFFTEATSDAKLSFKVTSTISAGDYHQLWHEIHTGASAAIDAVRTEFDAKPASNIAWKYLDQLAKGKQNTQLMLSVKGRHYPLNSATIRGYSKRQSLMKISHLYTKDLQGSSKELTLVGREPMMSSRKMSSTMLSSARYHLLGYKMVCYASCA